ncbi:MAG: sigma-70 family RNA polymerase sigma factor [Bacteroidota bacterium]
MSKARDSSDLLARIKAGESAFLRELYEEKRTNFIKWVLWQYSCSEEDAKDAYQRAFSILYFNVKNEKLTELNSSLDTYLYAIGKNVLRGILRSQMDAQPLDSVAASQVDGFDFFEQEQQNDQKQLTQQLLNEIGDPCKRILLMYYFRNYSLESIASSMGYKNEGIAKKKKFLCLQKLRDRWAASKVDERGIL